MKAASKSGFVLCACLCVSQALASVIAAGARQPRRDPAASAPANPADGATTVTLGPGAFTFPEIARQLSVRGRTVRPDPGLENCAASAYLKDRSWTQARDLV